MAKLSFMRPRTQLSRPNHGLDIGLRDHSRQGLRPRTTLYIVLKINA